MFKIFSGNRPDVTPAQAVATLIAGVPIVSNLLSAFNVFTISPIQQKALEDSITWGGVVAGLLIGGDALLRAARNNADAKVEAAAVVNGGEPADKSDQAPETS